MGTWRHYGDWTMSLLSWTVFTQMYREDKDANPMYLEFKNGLSSYYLREEILKEIKRKIAEKAELDPRYIDMKLRQLAATMKEDTRELRTINVELKQADADLADLFERYWRSFRDVVFGMAIDIYFDDIVCAQLEAFIKERLSELGKPEKFHEQYAALTAPMTLTRSQKEEIDLLQVLLLPVAERKAALRKHARKYGYIPMWFDNAQWTVADFEARERLYKNKEEILQRLAVVQAEIGVRKETVQRILKELKPNAKERKLISRIQKFAFLRQEGELQIGYHNFHGIPLKEKIAQALGISMRDLTFLTDEEIEANVRNKDAQLSELLRAREEHCFLISIDGVCNVYVGDEAKKISDDIQGKLSHEEVQPSNIHGKELTGVVGSVGFAKGSVRIVRGIQDIPKLLPGEILVVSGTSVEYLSAMQRSAAIIAEIGGITSHAAVVARELGKPCLTRVANATTLLKDGDFVEVDANNGRVRIIPHVARP